MEGHIFKRKAYQKMLQWKQDYGFAARGLAK